jgi:hypothetical protein
MPVEHTATSLPTRTLFPDSQIPNAMPNKSKVGEKTIALM